LINNTIGDDVRRIFPNAEFEMEYQGNYNNYTRRLMIIKIDGFIYENQPDFDNEITKWKEVTQGVSFKNYPYKIGIRYFFENTRYNFANIRLDDFYLSYTPLGMSKEGLANLSPILENYLYDFHNDFNILSDWHFSVTIHKELNRYDEPSEETMWKNFVILHNINTELVEIKVTYRQADTNVGRNYDVRQNLWY